MLNPGFYDVEVVWILFTVILWGGLCWSWVLCANYMQEFLSKDCPCLNGLQFVSVVSRFHVYMSILANEAGRAQYGPFWCCSCSSSAGSSCAGAEELLHQTPLLVERFYCGGWESRSYFARWEGIAGGAKKKSSFPCSSSCSAWQRSARSARLYVCSDKLAVLYEFTCPVCSGVSYAVSAVSWVNKIYFVQALTCKFLDSCKKNVFFFCLNSK